MVMILIMLLLLLLLLLSSSSLLLLLAIHRKLRKLKYARLGWTSVTNYRTKFHKIWFIGSSSGSRDTCIQRGNFTCQTNSMGPISPSADPQYILRLLYNLEIHYSVQRSPPTVSILSQTNPVHII